MKYFAILLSIALAIGCSQSANAQSDVSSKTEGAIQAPTSPSESTQTSQVQQSPTVKVKSAPKKIGFRLKEWKTIHSHSSKEAQVTIATLRKLGCDVESDNHGNHIDVKYRCPAWKSMKVGTDQLVNQWTTWCAGKGMETIVINPTATTQKPTVKFRLAIERSVHLHDAEQAKQILNTLKLVGCQVTSNQHGDHLDATFSCPQWVTIELPSEVAADGWQEWLDESGFETQLER